MKLKFVQVKNWVFTHPCSLHQGEGMNPHFLTDAPTRWDFQFAPHVKIIAKDDEDQQKSPSLCGSGTQNFDLSELSNGKTSLHFRHTRRCLFQCIEVLIS
jgi:hypothetical protein